MRSGAQLGGEAVEGYWARSSNTPTVPDIQLPLHKYLLHEKSDGQMSGCMYRGWGHVRMDRQMDRFMGIWMNHGWVCGQMNG